MAGRLPACVVDCGTGYGGLRAGVGKLRLRRENGGRRRRSGGERCGRVPPPAVSALAGRGARGGARRGRPPASPVSHSGLGGGGGREPPTGWVSPALPRRGALRRGRGGRLPGRADAGRGLPRPAPARPPLRAPPARCWGPEGSGAGTGLAEDEKREALLVGFARPPGQPCPGCGWGVGRIGFGKWEAKLGLSLAAHLLLLFHSRPFPSQPAS